MLRLLTVVQRSRQASCQATALIGDALAGSAPCAQRPFAAAHSINARVSSSATTSSTTSSAERATSAAAATPDHVIEVEVPQKSGWAAVPALPKVLGLTGLIPFYAFCPPIVKLAALHCSGVDALAGPLHQLLPLAAPLQIGYGTAIVSFLGAVHWGAAMQSRKGHTTKIMFERYVWSVTPALIAFPAGAMSVGMGSCVITMSLLAAFCVDAKFAWRGALPGWYMALRVPLTLGATGALLMTTWHAAYEAQLIVDYEHAVAQEPRAVEPEPEAVMYR